MKNEFTQDLLEAVDEGFLALGEVIKPAIYQYVERNCQVKREEIPGKLEAFHKCLEGVMGAAAKVIEKLIARKLYTKLSLSFEPHENWTLVNYVHYAKKVKG